MTLTMRLGAIRHRCQKEDIYWDRKISDVLVTEDGLGWFGTCRECGRRVYEVYAQLGCLHDAESDDDLGDE